MNEPKAGVMHPVDKAFYDLTVKERNAAWVENERLKQELAALRSARSDPPPTPSKDENAAYRRRIGLLE